MDQLNFMGLNNNCYSTFPDITVAPNYITELKIDLCQISIIEKLKKQMHVVCIWPLIKFFMTKLINFILLICL